jgi:hypothetical protein
MKKPPIFKKKEVNSLIKEAVKELINNKFIDKKEEKLVTFMFKILNEGPSKMIKSKDKDYLLWIKNLKKSNVLTRSNKIRVTEDLDGDNGGIQFVLLMACAKGYLKMVKTTNEKKNG